MEIGNAKYRGEFVKRKWFKLKDGESVFRVLPPLGNLAKAGRWSVHYAIHYGYEDSNGKVRAFASPEVRNPKTGMVEVPDAAAERIEMLKRQLAKAKSSGDTELASKIEKLVGGAKPKFNLDKNHYLNVIDLQGNIGVLKLRHKAKKALEQAIDTLRRDGVDPLSATDGRFFVFTRTGMGLDTTFSVNVLQEKLTVAGVGQVNRPVVHVLSEDILGRLDAEAADLDSLFKRPTSEQVARIVREGATAVDEVLNSNNGSSDSGEDSSDNDSVLPQTTTAVAPTAQVVAQAGVGTAPSKSDSAQAQAKSLSMSTPVQPSVTQTTAQAVDNMSEAEFLKSLGL